MKIFPLWKCLYLAVSLCLAWSPTAPAAAPSQAPAASTPTSAPTAANEDLSESLQTNGEKFRLYFTLESDNTDAHNGAIDAPGKGKASPLKYRRISLPAAKDGGTFLQALTQALPEADVIRDETLPDVVHIREKSLAGRSGYLLDEKVDFLFHGTIGEFRDTCAREFDWRLEEDLNSTTNSARFNEKLETQIHIKAAPFRTVLSAALPRWSNHLLWTAYALEKEGRLVARIKFSASSQPPTTTPATSPLPPGAVDEINSAMQRRHAVDLAAAIVVGQPDAPVSILTEPTRVEMSDTLITARIPLRNFPARVMLQDLQPLLAPPVVAGIINDPNCLVLRDTSAHIHTYLEIIGCLEDAAGGRRAAAVAQGADPRGLKWLESTPAPSVASATAQAPATTMQATSPKDAPDPALSPVYRGANLSQIAVTDDVITQVVPLRQYPVAPVLADVKPLLSPQAIVVASPTANCLVVRDTGARIKRLVEIIEKLEQQPPHSATQTQPANSARSE